jgi:hypothetical protein
MLFNYPVAVLEAKISLKIFIYERNTVPAPTAVLGRRIINISVLAGLLLFRLRNTVK